MFGSRTAVVQVPRVHTLSQEGESDSESCCRALRGLLSAQPPSDMCRKHLSAPSSSYSEEIHLRDWVEVRFEKKKNCAERSLFSGMPDLHGNSKLSVHSVGGE